MPKVFLTKRECMLLGSYIGFMNKHATSSGRVEFPPFSQETTDLVRQRLRKQLTDEEREAYQKEHHEYMAEVER